MVKYHSSSSLTAIDGRNRNKLTSLIPYLSDLALDRERIKIELAYLRKLAEYKLIRPLTVGEIGKLDELVKRFNEREYERVRKIERRTNHEMKAVEKYIQETLNKTSMKDIAEMVHFGLTTDDVNNIAYSLIFKKALHKVLVPELTKILELLKDSARKFKSLAMLSRTHGQPAVPTTVGKEFLVYFKRLIEEVEALKKMEFRAKLTGNVGNLNAHKFLYPKINWLVFSREFIGEFGLTPDLITTQIEPYDGLIKLFQTLLRTNNILKGLCIDFWIYVSFGYFRQTVIKNEVGSTALPHKVNPIYFEGAEGGFGVANVLLNFYSDKLSYSRLQRDLSDSTVRRSVPMAFGYCLLSYQSVSEALRRIEPDTVKISQDLENHKEILSEAIQNFLRTRKYKEAYDKTKEFFRGKTISKSEVNRFIERLNISKDDKMILLKLSVSNYTGYSEELVGLYAK